MLLVRLKSRARCVLCLRQGVCRVAPALLGLGVPAAARAAGIVPAWQKGFSRQEGRGATWHAREEAGAPGLVVQELSAGRALPCLRCPVCRSLSSPCPVGALCLLQPPASICPSGDCNRDRGRLSAVLGCLAGLLFWCVCVCVWWCFDNHEKFYIITFKQTPLVLLLYF